ncbi:5-methylcytosine-specific restriction endonuclease system specificity protein McrC [uncultured Microbacterium sp.]|uniref:5-methylcytosine-specific restriction endonuclease system specificity protein McrC n=1 Tax=uncultured Microbacterium sp. TaxID=191216 RepID=UPI002598CDEF|nr:5-methylcytosine-specific restriction endonuclease system specificity protein McrC [uncultured Microbacterium sp.]
MIDRSIAIRNVYVMLAYAFRALRSTGTARIAAEEFDHLHDLLAEILAVGVGSQVKRGLHRDYLARSEELGTVRGRIDVTRSVGARTLTRGRLICEFDEYEVDTPHNQALKSVIILLLRHGEVKEPRRDALRHVLPYLDEVTLISPRSIRWDALIYHRSNASYRLLLGVCELIVRGLLPTEDTGAARLTEWMSDDAMSRLYERFLRQYYAFHHPELSPGAPTIAWDLDSPSLFGGQLPAMQTDVTLRRGGRTLIVDAKYYKQNLQEGRFGTQTVDSANLYQMLAYVKNEDTAHDGSVAGLLLYAQTDADVQPDLDVVIQGNRIGAQTLDLNQPWASLAARLEEVLDWLDPVPESVAS